LVSVLGGDSAHPWCGYGFGQGVLALREVAAQMPPARNTISMRTASCST
jgi:hypothetical protein